MEWFSITCCITGVSTIVNSIIIDDGSLLLYDDKIALSFDQYHASIPLSQVEHIFYYTFRSLGTHHTSLLSIQERDNPINYVLTITDNITPLVEHLVKKKIMLINCETEGLDIIPIKVRGVSQFALINEQMLCLPFYSEFFLVNRQNKVILIERIGSFSPLERVTALDKNERVLPYFICDNPSKAKEVMKKNKWDMRQWEHKSVDLDELLKNHEQESTLFISTLHPLSDS